MTTGEDQNKKDLYTGSFAVFESSSFVTMVRWSLRSTAFPLCVFPCVFPIKSFRFSASYRGICRLGSTL